MRLSNQKKNSIKNFYICGESENLLNLYSSKLWGLGFDTSKQTLHQLLGDEETLAVKEESFDMVVSCNNLHFNNEMENSLTHLLEMLVDDGCLIGSVPGSETLNELRNVFYIVENERFGGYSQRLLKFPDGTFFSNSINRLGYRMCAVHSHSEEITFGNIFELMYGLKDNGLGKCISNSDSIISKDLFLAASAVYDNLYYPKGDRSKIKATFQHLVFIGYKQKEGQVKRTKKTLNMDEFKDYLKQDPEIIDKVKFGTITEEEGPEGSEEPKNK